MQASIYLLKRPNGRGNLKIRLNWNGQRYEQASGNSIELKHWDSDRKQVKRLSKNEELKRIHSDLARKCERLEQSWQKLEHLKPGFTASDFRAFLEGDLDPVRGTKMDFLPWVTQFIDDFDTRPMPGGSKAGAIATKKKYQSDLLILEAFAASEDEDLSWENMDASFCRKMRQWRASLPANYFRKGYSQTTRTSEGTIGRWVKTVRGWITRARSEGIHSFDHHLHPEWTVKEADVLRFALSKKQLDAFLDWDVPDTPAAQGGAPRTGVKKARDLFCVQCTTGVRVSDLPQIIQQYNEDPKRDTFNVHMKKTDAAVTVPVMDLVHKVAARHDGKLPDIGALTRFNKLLRKGAKLCGLFDQKMLKPVLDDNGQRKMQEVEQWELVTSHAARRTFATYLVGKGLPTKTVMSMTGHKVESEFNKYLNLNAHDTAMMVKEIAGL